MYVFNGKIVSCLLNYELNEYIQLQRESKESEVPLFRELEREGKEMVKAINLEKLAKTGNIIYSSWGAHAEGYSKRGKTTQAFIYYNWLKTQGFTSMLFRSSNNRLKKIFEPLGGKVIEQVPFVQAGKTFELYILALDLCTK